MAAERLVSSGRPVSIVATSSATLVRLIRAISDSAVQNGSSRETLVRCPATLSERFATG
jgi:hypothetical protein